NCDREKVLLVEAGEMGPSPHRAPICRCDECDGVMDFDDMEDSYFAFMSTARKVPESAKISQFVAELAGENADRSKIRSRVGSTPAAAGLSATASSLPSVPSLPSLSKAAATPRPSGQYMAQTASSAVSIPGHTTTGNRGFAGGGSNPGNSGVRAPSLDSHRFAKAIAEPRSGRLVYVLVFVLIAAICVLAVLLFSGNGDRDVPPPRKTSSAAVK